MIADDEHFFFLETGLLLGLTSLEVLGEDSIGFSFLSSLVFSLLVLFIVSASWEVLQALTVQKSWCSGDA
jgi:hypothetical protein